MQTYQAKHNRLKLYFVLNFCLLCRVAAQDKINSNKTVLTSADVDNFTNITRSTIANSTALAEQSRWPSSWNLNWLSLFGLSNTTYQSAAVVQQSPTAYEPMDQHPCRRVCQQGQSLNCYYKLVVHNYQRLGPECQRCQYDVKACEAEQCIYGDGIPTAIMAINSMMPGPAIEVCLNDTLIIDVVNHLTEPTTLHWHGLRMSGAPDMDGVPFVTQYPIQPAQLYRYAFRAERVGTVWYHSQHAWQRALGVAGAFVIRQPWQANPHAGLYDYDLIEHTLLIGDVVYNYNFNRIANILINGKGRNHLTTLPDSDPRHRYERLRVTPGYRYRMRVVSNGIFNCPLEFSVDQHRMLIISTDGNDIVPVLADSFYLASAERFDFVLEADQRTDNYWVRVRGYNNCSMEQLYQGAVLHYRGAARSVAPLRSLAVAQQEKNRAVAQPQDEAIIVNKPWELRQQTATNGLKPVNSSVLERASVDLTTASLQSLRPLTWSRHTKFQTHYSSLNMRTERNGEVNFQIDDITYASPALSLLQARHLYREEAYFCNRSSLHSYSEDCLRNHCQCTNVVHLPAYQPIEMVVANFMKTTHPFHVHGYTYRVVGQGVVASAVELRRLPELDRRGLLPRSAPDFSAVEKDTIQIPGLGYVIVRFISDNPGFWLYHSHIELYSLSGMAAVMKVGRNDQIKVIPMKNRC